MRSTAAAAAVMMVVGAGCRTGQPRPLEPAQSRVVDAAVGETFTAAVAALADNAIPVRRTDRERRVIEGEYFDIIQQVPDARQYPPAERRLRIRIVFEADSLGRGAAVSVFALYLPFGSRATYSERNERSIPRGHPGFQLVSRLLQGIRAHAER